jgi:DNA-binding transcriptional MerR regulator
VNRTELSQADAADTGRRVTKSANAFRTTGEVAAALDLPAHVLRFWESKFPQVKPLKRGGGRRYYRPEDVDLLRRIRQCLYQQGYTIRGVQKLLREGALRGDAPPPPPSDEESPPALFALALAPPAGPLETVTSPTPTQQSLREALKEVRRELLEIRTLVDKLRLIEKAEPSRTGLAGPLRC